MRIALHPDLWKGNVSVTYLDRIEGKIIPNEVTESFCFQQSFPSSFYQWDHGSEQTRQYISQATTTNVHGHAVTNLILEIVIVQSRVSSVRNPHDSFISDEVSDEASRQYQCHRRNEDFHLYRSLY